jgi:hypothetical protein
VTTTLFAATQSTIAPLTATVAATPAPILAVTPASTISADVATVAATPVTATPTVDSVSTAASPAISVVNAPAVAPIADTTIVSPPPVKTPAVAKPAKVSHQSSSSSPVMEVSRTGRPLAASRKPRVAVEPFVPPASPILNDDLLVGVWNAIAGGSQGSLFSDILLKD